MNEELKHYFAAAPQPIQDFLTGEGLAKALSGIQTKHNLHIDQAGTVENHVVLILLGLEHPNDLYGNLKLGMTLPESVLEQLVADVDREILHPMHDEIIRLHNEKASVENDTPQQPRPTIEHSSLVNSVGKRLNETIQNPRQEKELPKTNDPYREPIE